MAEATTLNEPNKKRIFAKIILVIVVILFFILLLEVLLRFTYPFYSNFNTEMWKYSKDIKTLSNITNVSHVHLPNKHSVLYGVDFATSSLGFRDYEYPIDRASMVNRILVLGDSVTLGWGVNLNNSYPKVLERMLNSNPQQISDPKIKYEVINTAVGNYNTEMEVNALEKQLYLKPNAVVVGFFPNDAEKTVITNDNFVYWFKKAFYLYPFFWDKYSKLSYLFASRNGNYTSLVHSYYTDQYGGKENLNRAFLKLKDLSERNGFKVYVVIIPQFYNEFKDYDLKDVHSYVLELCKMERFICVDSLDDFRPYALKDIIISYEDAHPNAVGHKIIAENIFGMIKNDK